MPKGYKISIARGSSVSNPRVVFGYSYSRGKLQKQIPGVSSIDFDYAANFDDFLADRDKDKPFFWYGSSKPHRSYATVRWQSQGIETGAGASAQVPAFLKEQDDPRMRVETPWDTYPFFDKRISRNPNRGNEGFPTTSVNVR